MATNQALIHYALDLETPPVIACGRSATGAITSPTASEVTCPRCMATEHFPRLQEALRPLRQDQERALIRPSVAEGPIVTPFDLLMNAADLLSDEGENEEYDRAIVELTSTLIWGTTEDPGKMTSILRALKRGE